MTDYDEQSDDNNNNNNNQSQDESLIKKSVIDIKRYKGYKTGVPCPNHAFVPILNHSNYLLKDIITNQILLLLHLNNQQINCKNILILNGKCNINHDFQINEPPINHIPDDYEFTGTTLFLSLIIPKEININNNQTGSSLFEWNIQKILTFNIKFGGDNNYLCITDNLDSFHHSPISLDYITKNNSNNNKKQLMIMISVTKNRYSIYTNCDSYQFTKAICIQNNEFPYKTKQLFKMTKHKNDKLDGIGIQQIALWRWVALDFDAFLYLCKWKDIFIQSLQHLNPIKESIIFDKNYNNTHYTVVNILNNQLNQYSIMLYFKLNEKKLKTPICLLQIPDDLLSSMLERDESIFELVETPQKNKNKNIKTKNIKTINVKSEANSPRQEIRISTPSSYNINNNNNNNNNGSNPNIPMIWIDKKGFIWICDQKINKKISIGEEHSIVLCVNLKKRQLSLMFHTDEIIKINLKTSINTQFKWQKNFKLNGCWSLKSTLNFG
eukprot:481095_1